MADTKKLSHEAKKELQEKQMSNRYHKINELSKGEFFKRLRDLDKVNKDIGALKLRKTLLKEQIQEFLSGKATPEKEKK